MTEPNWVYVVTGHHKYEGDDVLFVTSDPASADERAKHLGGFDRTDIQRWDAATGRQDASFEGGYC